YRLFIEDGFVHNQNLSITGGTEKGRYNISLGLFDNKGIIPNHKFTRYNTRLNFDQNIGKRFLVGISSLATYTLSNALDVDPLAGAGSDYGAFSENPLGVPYDADGNLIFRNTPGDGNRTNPLYDIIPENVINRRRGLKLFNSIYGEVKLTDNLKFRVNFGPELTYNSLGNFRGSKTQVNAGGPSSANVDNEFIFAYTWENIVSYSATLAEKHRFDFTGLYSRQLRQGESNGSGVRGLPVDAFEYYNLGAAGEYLDINSDYEKWSIASYMARLNYVFDDRYLVTLTGRADGSSKFAEGNKWGYFPSVALGWNITNESFFTASNTLSSLRLRASLGTTGNEGINPYRTKGLLERTGYLFGSTPAFGYVPNSIRNDALKWESTTNLNFGVDFDMFQGRATGAIEVYQSNTKDLLLPRLLPNTSGFSEILTNVGSTRNTGIEFLVSTINIVPKEAGGFGWNTDFNFSSNKEEIVELSQGKVDDVGNLRFIGQPITVYYDFERIGIWQQGEETLAAAGNSGVGYIKVKDQNGDGAISPNDDRVILGSNVPDFIAGLTNRFSFKGFDLSIVAYARVGQMIEDFSYGSNRFNSGRVNMFDLDYWTPSNPTNYIPRPNTSLETPYFGSTLRYFDGSFVKIRNINLGYNFPATVASKMGMQSLNVFVSVQNPVFISSYVSKYNGVDPEFPTRSTPVSRTYMAGINVNF
ncbi:MAG: SusC/RagA family TonB-linked outer membrane protein, partial [Bacteroidota bacterium]|nr:SusC/RagA family TonB-linked outer membrane protein [Bacteroidota bacterium]